MLSEITSAWRMQSNDVIRRVDSNEELANRLQHSQVRGIAHDILDDIHIQRAYYSWNLLALFALSLL